MLFSMVFLWRKNNLNLERKKNTFFFKQIVVVFCSSRLRDQWDLFCDIDVWPTQKSQNLIGISSSMSGTGGGSTFFASLASCALPMAWGSLQPAALQLFSRAAALRVVRRNGGDLAVIFQPEWINLRSCSFTIQGTADGSHDSYFKTSRFLMFKYPKKKLNTKSMYFPNGCFNNASWFSRTNSSSNDGPALVIWLRSDMVPFLASSCQFSPMAFLESNTSNRKSNKLHGTPRSCSQCSHASDVERLSLILQTSWKHATHLPQHHLSRLHCVF